MAKRTRYRQSKRFSSAECLGSLLETTVRSSTIQEGVRIELLPDLVKTAPWCQEETQDTLDGLCFFTSLGQEDPLWSWLLSWERSLGLSAQSAPPHNPTPDKQRIMNGFLYWQSNMKETDILQKSQCQEFNSGQLTQGLTASIFGLCAQPTARYSKQLKIVKINHLDLIQSPSKVSSCSST